MIERGKTYRTKGGLHVRIQQYNKIHDVYFGYLQDVLGWNGPLMYNPDGSQCTLES